MDASVGLTGHVSNAKCLHDIGGKFLEIRAAGEVGGGSAATDGDDVYVVGGGPGLGAGVSADETNTKV